jgi:hypothetical protein
MNDFRINYSFIVFILFSRHRNCKSQKNSILGQFIQKCSAWSKMSCISALFEMAQLKKSNFQATLPHCTPVLLRKTAPNEPTRKRFGTTTYY